MTDASAVPAVVGTVRALYRYPVKSMQGLPVDRIEVGPGGVGGDRAWGLIDDERGTLVSAKRIGRLLDATVDEHDGTTRITVPGGAAPVAVDDPDASAVVSAWLGRPVTLTPAPAPAGGGGAVEYEMTFDPPDDDAEYVRIPAPAGTFLDLAALHLVTTSTLDGAAGARPDLDWDVRRFRPNVVVDTDGEPFGEDAWCGRPLHIGAARLSARQPTVRCAMPLRAQPGLDRQAGLYRALEELHANHLGIYLDVAGPGPIAVGDPVVLG